MRQTNTKRYHNFTACFFSTHFIPRKIITRFILHLKIEIKAKNLVSYFSRLLYAISFYKLVAENISISIYQGEFKLDLILRCLQLISTYYLPKLVQKHNFLNYVCNVLL